MPRSAAQGEARRRHLARELAAGRDVCTATVARRLGVSPMTIRRDLRKLAKAGVALRRYGGAVAAQRITFEFAFDDRRRRCLRQKRRIGVMAAQRVVAGQRVLLDTGTTTLEIARELAHRRIPCTVITSSLVIASELWAREGVELVLVGGRVRRGSPDLVGPGSELMLQKLTADIAFLGSEGIHPERGTFAGDMESAHVAERMAASARRVVVVADSTKLGHAGAARCIPIGDITEIVTDTGADKATLRALRRKGVEVTTV